MKELVNFLISLAPNDRAIRITTDKEKIGINVWDPNPFNAQHLKELCNKCDLDHTLFPSDGTKAPLLWVGVGAPPSSKEDLLAELNRAKS